MGGRFLFVLGPPRGYALALARRAVTLKTEVCMPRVSPRPLILLVLLLSVAAAGCGSSGSKPSTDPTGGGGSKGKKEDGPKPYAEVVTKDAETQTGMFDVHEVGTSLFFEIPESLLGRDILLVSRIARVPADLAGGFMAAGHKTGEQVVRWERVDDRILLRKVSYANVADEELPIYRSVMNNNFAPILAAFDVAAEGPAPDTVTASSNGLSAVAMEREKTVVIDVTNLYVDDIPAISGLGRSLRDSYKVRRLDKDRSFLNHAGAYPLNVEVRHTLTFVTQSPPTDESTETLSLEMQQSMILLPEEPMRPRFADSRVGWFSLTQVNYGLDRQKAAEQTLIGRWRLEPRDPAAYARGELVEPVKPIVYYLDPATPETWRPYVRQGIEDWQVAFESAGFRNAILAKDAPSAEEDPDWNGEDVRYSVVRWAATQVRNAMGPSTWDPRSGEIIESDIVWYHNHMRSYRNRILIETGASNPLARSLPIDEALMGEAMRQVIAHEVGHALGLPHNMIASSAYPVDSLRVPEFCKRMGVAPTIMDYARQNYIAQPGDGLQGADYIRQIGPYDHYAINWGYRVIPEAATAEDEKPVLDAWILEKAGDPIYRFARQRGGSPVDPRIQTEDLGDDPVRASGYGIANLKQVAPRLIEWTSTPGEDFTDLREIYAGMMGQWWTYLRHVVPVVGGIHEELKASDQEGVVYTPVSAQEQRAAMEFLAAEAFATQEWLSDPEILRRFEHTGTVDRIRGLQVRVLNDLLSPERLQRLIETETLEGSSAYSPVEFMADLKASIWSEIRGSSRVDTYRRNLQRAYLERLEFLMTQDPSTSSNTFLWRTPVDVSQSDIRALVRSQLKEIQREARAAAGRQGAGMTRMHWQDVADRVDEMLERVKLGG